MRLEWLTCCITDTQPYYSLQSAPQTFAQCYPQHFYIKLYVMKVLKFFLPWVSPWIAPSDNFQKSHMKLLMKSFGGSSTVYRCSSRRYLSCSFLDLKPSLYPPKFNQISGLWLPYLCFVTFFVTYPILVCFFLIWKCQVGYIGAFRKTWNSVIVTTWRSKWILL